MTIRNNLARFSGALSLALTALFTPQSVQAHSTWLEQAQGQTWLHFGEFEMNLREGSPGYLDGFGKPQATLIMADGKQSIVAEKTATGFKISVPPGELLAMVAFDADYPLRTNTQDGTTTWSYHGARLITSAQAQDPILPLDLTPTGEAGKFRLTFKNKPLSRVKVEAFTQSGWSYAAYSDKEGLVSLPFPWQGQYVISAQHIDATPGQRDGKPYDRIRYPFSATWVQSQGLPALPAPAPMPAYKPK